MFGEAAALGALHVHLSGGEPTARRDIVELTRGASQERALYQPHHLGHWGQREADGRSGREPASTTRSCRSRAPTRRSTTGSATTKARGSASAPSAAMVTRAGLPLTINAVVHRGNLHQVGASSISRSNSARAGWKSRIRSITAGRSPIAPR